MTRDEWDSLLKQINLAWPGTPLSDAQGDAYFAVLQDLEKDECSRAIVELVTAGADTVPPPHRILRVAAEQGAAGPTTTPLTPAIPQAKESSSEPPAESEPSWLRRNAKILATGAIALAVGVGIGAGTALLSAPDADVAFGQGKTEGFAEGRTEGIDIGDARGFSRGKRAGYRSGLSDGRARGFSEGKDAGRADVFDSLEGGPPSVGSWYLIRYGSDNSIDSWFSDPFPTNTCKALEWSGGDSYTLREYGYCNG